MTRLRIDRLRLRIRGTAPDDPRALAGAIARSLAAHPAIAAAGAAPGAISRPVATAVTAAIRGKERR